ncbi:Hypothetical protein CINCED_3A019126 [Cinara cedri]|uniref:Uncharacterized protein n=1 Tax=Cinara cedri TaxID=506608 RepID=A0A5E4LXU7_9HEMI|nr:Hypothetical protein CINCED_3A019126 [Cinara cedri]
MTCSVYGPDKEAMVDWLLDERFTWERPFGSEDAHAEKKSVADGFRKRGGLENGRTGLPGSLQSSINGGGGGESIEKTDSPLLSVNDEKKKEIVQTERSRNTFPAVYLHYRIHAEHRPESKHGESALPCPRNANNSDDIAVGEYRARALARFAG